MTDEEEKKELKKCKHCGIEKNIAEYNKAGGGKWLQPYCKPCDSIRKRKYSESNKDKVLASRRKYYSDNKDDILIKTKDYIKKNKDKVDERRKKYYNAHREEKRINDREYGRLNRNKISNQQKQKRKSNPELYQLQLKKFRESKTPEQKERNRIQQKAWRTLNKDKIKAQRQLPEVKARTRERNRINNNNKSATDISFRIIKNLRSRTRFALKKWDTIKTDTTENLLGCSIVEFKIYFTSLFSEGMNWDSFLRGEIHIDHKIPCVNFDLRFPDEQRKCFHYTNLQPLWKIDNLKKGVQLLKQIG